MIMLFKKLIVVLLGGSVVCGFGVWSVKENCLVV